ncbi:hypothetical protein BaRGS_00027501 [Batillaria attramentaria]|uniref:Uncharacterized protein n=1 Tax=Batillaria attramentaria TaxID=370345 RepID=A0ABD0K2L6_9CAEN
MILHTAACPHRLEMGGVQARMRYPTFEKTRTVLNRCPQRVLCRSTGSARMHRVCIWMVTTALSDWRSFAVHFVSPVHVTNNQQLLIGP